MKIIHYYSILFTGVLKVYAPAMAGAPPMSVPHLDWRTIYGKDCIFFGPFAGFKPTVYVNKSGLANVAESGRLRPSGAAGANFFGGAVWGVFRENANCGDPPG